MQHYVIIGAGQAGSACAARLRKRGFDGRITLIGEEPHLPYQRPPLSKAYLLGEMDRDRLFLRPQSFYADADITLRLGKPVTHIDRAARTLHLGGETIGYDKLAITTGLRPRRLPAAIGGALQGVYTIRTLADVDAMEGPFKTARRVLVVGGGYIGLEGAAVARKLGLEVTLIEAADRILGRVAAPETAEFFRALHRDHGVELREGVGLDRLTGERHVTGAVLSDGSETPADIVIAGIGLLPDVPLAEEAGLECGGGIVVDDHGQTSDPAIWAAGDCANLPFRGQRMRLESVQNAIDQAEAVADNMTGADAPYDPKPWFWSDQYDVKLQIAGLNAGYDRVVVRRGATAGSRSHWYYGGETLLAVDAMNDPRGYMIGKRLIEAGKSPAPSVIEDPETDMKALLG